MERIFGRESVPWQVGIVDRQNPEEILVCLGGFRVRLRHSGVCCRFVLRSLQLATRFDRHDSAVGGRFRFCGLLLDWTRRLGRILSLPSFYS
jgi:hypothetical protein